MEREKRHHQRIQIDAAAQIERTGEPPTPAVVRDISVGGAFIVSTQSLPFGTELTLLIALRNEPQPVHLPGVVRWAHPEGFGIQFGLLGARETYAITQLLKA